MVLPLFYLANIPANLVEQQTRHRFVCCTRVNTRFIGLEPLTTTFCAKRQKSLFGFLRSFSSEKDLKPRGSDWSAERDDWRHWSEATDCRRSRSSRERLLKFGLFFLAVIDFFSVEDGYGEEGHNYAYGEGDYDA